VLILWLRWGWWVGDGVRLRVGMVLVMVRMLGVVKVVVVVVRMMVVCEGCVVL
jgi:hypothetical protein